MDKVSDVDIFVCPADRSPLVLIDDSLRCGACGKEYLIKDGLVYFSSSVEWEEQYLENSCHYASSEPNKLVEEDMGYIVHRGDDQYGTILDMGCGDGVFSSKIPPASMSYCVDVTEVGLRRLQMRGLPNLIPVLASGFELPFPDNSFDTILYVFVVEHIEVGLDLQMLNELGRVLHKNGKVIYTTDTPFFDRHIVRWTSLFLRFKWIEQDHSSKTGHINLLTMEQSRDLVRNAGFEIEAEHPYWMGTRLKWWMCVVFLLRKLLPQDTCENYLTSKYTFVLTRDKENKGA